MAGPARAATRHRNAGRRPAGALQALAVDRAKMTVWQLAPGSPAWAKAQSITVPIQFGSSS